MVLGDEIRYHTLPIFRLADDVFDMRVLEALRDFLVIFQLINIKNDGVVFVYLL